MVPTYMCTRIDSMHVWTYVCTRIDSMHVWTYVCTRVEILCMLRCSSFRLPKNNYVMQFDEMCQL